MYSHITTDFNCLVANRVLCLDCVCSSSARMIYSGYTDASTSDDLPICDDKDLKGVDAVVIHIHTAFSSFQTPEGGSGTLFFSPSAAQGHVGLLEKATTASGPFGLEAPPRAPSHQVGRERLGARDRSRSHSSPPTSRAQVLQPQSKLHQRKGSHRATGFISGKENSIRDTSHKAGHGKTRGQSRRPVLGDVTNVYREIPANPHRNDDSFANSTAVNTPGRKGTQNACSHTSSRGLMIELDGKPLLDVHQDSMTGQDVDDDHCLVYRTAEDFLPQVISNPVCSIKAEQVVGPGPLAHILSDSVKGLKAKAPAALTTPLCEALATFGDIFSPSSTFRTKYGSVNGEGAPQPSRRPSATTLPAIKIPLTSFKISNLTGSITQFTGELAALLAAHCENENWGQSQYEEDAVARDERFDWEEEMRSLEVQCGVYGDKE